VKSLTGKTALVVGASRGLGRGVVEAFAGEGANAVAVARNADALSALSAKGIQTAAADAADPVVAGMLLERHRPDVLALVAGAVPLLRPIHMYTWETFSMNWNVDVRIAFNWLRESMLLPLRSGSRVIVMSSGAALAGSAVSGGYAGAKATVRFIAAYAREESERAGLGISFVSILPRLTDATELGRPAVAAYAARRGISEAEFMKQMGPPVTPEVAGAAFVRLATEEPPPTSAAYTLSGEGLEPIR
jgi:NAD(P)-dependent dehydrogenase (short-subunit alcohol dehydrogenase family)